MLACLIDIVAAAVDGAGDKAKNADSRRAQSGCCAIIWLILEDSYNGNNNSDNNKKSSNNDSSSSILAETSGIRSGYARRNAKASIEHKRCLAVNTFATTTLYHSMPTAAGTRIMAVLDMQHDHTHMFL